MTANKRLSWPKVVPYSWALLSILLLDKKRRAARSELILLNKYKSIKKTKNFIDFKKKGYNGSNRVMSRYFQGACGNCEQQ